MTDYPLLQHQPSLGLCALKPRACKQWIIGLLLLWMSAACAESSGESAFPAAATNSDCSNCHEQQTKAWQRSHHALAMAAATQAKGEDSLQLSPAVLGDFSDATAQHHGLSATFRTVDGHPVMSLKRDNRTKHYLVTHSFGVTPLQQYLTKTEDGRRQVLPFSWDTRPKTEGGQRWITLHPGEDITPADRLHWQQPLANWNGMCADCHSTGLVRNYSTETNQFATTSTHLNVGCGSCHGVNPHEANPIARGSSAGFKPRYPLANSENKTAAAENDLDRASSARKTAEICAGCHSLRTPLVDGINPELPYLDQFAPSLLNPTLYFPDGQIKEEVYVWGSFLQSRMHAEGVTCGNCHDPHSQKLKAEGNALCGQCHLAQQYDTQAHHQHDPKSTGAQCVNCHMPTRTYMVVDDRRDHSFHVPDPLLSQSLGSPDACTSCHEGKSQQWAASALGDWRGNETSAVATSSSATKNPHKALWQHQFNGSALTNESLAKLLGDKTLPEISRASALMQQASLSGALTPELLRTALASKEPILTLAAANASGSLPITQRETLLAPLLAHQFRAIRIAAANQLRDSNLLTASASKESPSRAFNEADTADRVSSWRGEGLLNQGLNAEREGETASAVQNYTQAISRDPYFEPGYINLTELYRRQGDSRREQLIYTQGLKALPNSTVLRYSYALHLIRRKNPAGALKQTTYALSKDPASQSNAYLHMLLYDNLGKTQQGILWLRNNLKHHRQSTQVLQIGAKQAQKLGDTESLTVFATALKSLSQ